MDNIIPLKNKEKNIHRKFEVERFLLILQTRNMTFFLLDTSTLVLHISKLAGLKIRFHNIYSIHTIIYNLDSVVFLKLQKKSYNQ